MSTIQLPSLLLAAFTFVSLATAQEWSRFRGTNGEGVSGSSLPTTWTDKDRLWKSAVPGIGHSSPVLWGDKLFLTAGEAKTGKRIVLCYKANDGTSRWEKSFDGEVYHTHQRNSFATSTPVVDAERVYICWATPKQLTVQALRHDGTLAWQKDLGAFKSQHGFGVSPIRYGDLLILPNDQDNSGNLTALDAATGQIRWTLPRKPKNATYSTPCIYQIGDRPAEIIVTNWQHGITAVDPKTGKVNWELSCFNTTTQERAIASPILAGDLIIGTCGFVTGTKHHVAVRLEDGKPKEIWRVERQVSYLPTPLVKDERIYLMSEQGWATCLDRKTGKEIWQERIGGGFSASPVCAGEHIYCIANDGQVHVLKAGDKYDRVAKNELGEGTQATPAIADGRMFIRTEKSLICIGKK